MLLYLPADITYPAAHTREQNCARLNIRLYIKLHIQKVLYMPKSVHGAHRNATKADFIHFPWPQRCEQKCKWLVRSIHHAAPAYISILSGWEASLRKSKLQTEFVESGNIVKLTTSEASGNITTLRTLEST
jgi:hypothetical protein